MAVQKHNGLVTPPSPRSLWVDSNRLQMRGKRSGLRSCSLGVDTTTTSEDFPSKSSPRMSSPTSSIPFSHDVEKVEGRQLHQSLGVHMMLLSMDSVGRDTTMSSPVTSMAKGDDLYTVGSTIQGSGPFELTFFQKQLI